MRTALLLLLACRDAPDETPIPPDPTTPIRCVAPDRAPGAVDVVLTRVYPDVPLVPQTTTLLQDPAIPGWWYVLEQEGRVVRFAADPAANAVEEVLALDAVDCCEERGLLGMAFHPDFAENGYVYLDYSVILPDGDNASVVARYTSRDGGATLDPASELPILVYAKPFANHNGGHLEFGPDGMLYIGWGDGGGDGDPFDQSQDPDTLLGKILRIDVDHPEGLGTYGIPADNPFALGGGAPEVWARGFRNPWRWQFDPGTGDLWLGDVGMSDYEEVDRVVAGGNYGWRRIEGPACYEPATGCDPTAFDPPIVALATGTADAVIGGLVYRGTAIPALYGRYVFSDYTGDDVFVLPPDPAPGSTAVEVALSGSEDLVDWAYGADGEAYALGLAGVVFRLEPRVGPPSAPFPQTLSQTGCMDPADPALPGPDLVPFEPAVPFWSDGLEKSRWMFVPAGKTLTVDDGDHLVLPIGSVVFKEFRSGETRVETRMLVHHPDGWAGYGYRWRTDGTDADLLPGNLLVEVAGNPWEVPSRGQCMTCHGAAAGRTLGLTLAQLDHPFASAPDGPNQLDDLVTRGLLAAGVPHPGSLPGTDSAAPLEDRARSWLQVNCAHCHQPGGGTPVDLDLRRDTPLAETGVCDTPRQGDLGIADAQIVAPGNPDASVLYARLAQRGRDQMPPFGTFVVDEEAAPVIADWIAGLASCP
jgi:uncharacterized repeat protein (TIGR03806 family)